jgi:hypothetical protein
MTTTNITACQGCGGNTFTLLGALGRLAHVQCRACGLLASTSSEFVEVAYEDDTTATEY